MGNSVFRDRMLAATRILRGEERTLNRRVASLYAQCAKALEAEIAKYGSDSLTGRRADLIRRDMQQYIRQLWQDVHQTTMGAVQRGAQIATDAHVSVLGDILRGVGVDRRLPYQDAFGRANLEAVQAVLNGDIYRGANAGLSKRIWNHAAVQNGEMERLIAQAAATGRPATELAKDLQVYVDPGAQLPDHWNDVYDVPFPFRVDYNAKRLAVASLNHAYYQGMILGARDNPFAEYLHWELSSFHLIYDICDIYMEHDEGLGLGNFSLDNAPLPHPWCRCNYYIDSSKNLEEIGDEIGRWMAGEENPRMDAAFGEWNERTQAALDFSAKGSIISLPDIKVVRSVGSRHVDDFAVMAPSGEKLYLIHGEYIRDVKVFAGKGTSVRLRNAYNLEETYNIPAKEWQKVKGKALLDYHGEPYMAEIHWYQAEGAGRVEAKIKMQPDGRWWINDR